MHQRTVVLENGWLYLSYLSPQCRGNQLKEIQQLVHRCGGSTLLLFIVNSSDLSWGANYAHRFLDICGITSCFPFNCRHEHVREHQNSAILSADDMSGKDEDENNNATAAGMSYAEANLFALEIQALTSSVCKSDIFVRCMPA